MRKTISMILALCLLFTGVAFATVLGEYPITTEPMTLTAWAVLPPAATNTFNENAAALELERITGIHVEFDCVSYNGQEEKRALMLSSGNYPNFFFCGEFTNDEISQLVRQDKLYALDDFLQYAPNLTALFDRIEGLEGAMRSEDGHIYALGNVQKPAMTNHYVINMKWLEAVGKEIPTTLDEFYDVLVAFKEQDANGNGDPNDEIPLSMMGFKQLYILMTAFGIFPSAANDDGMYVYPGETEVKCTWIEDGFKEALEYFHKLYDEGLLDSEFLVNNWGTYTAKGMANTLGTFHAQGAFLFVGNDHHFDYQGLAPFEDPNGNHYSAKREIVKGNAFCITKTSTEEEAIAAMRWADYFYSEEGAILALMGVEGQTYEWISDDVWDWILPEGMTTAEWRHNSAFQGGNSYPGAHPELFDGKVWSKQNDEIERSLDGPQFRQPQTDCGQLVWPVIKTSAATQEELSFVTTDINAFVLSKAADFITGVADIDAEWDSYVATVKDMGVEKAIAMYQALYDNYLAMND